MHWNPLFCKGAGADVCILSAALLKMFEVRTPKSSQLMLSYSLKTGTQTENSKSDKSHLENTFRPLPLLGVRGDTWHLKYFHCNLLLYLAAKFLMIFILNRGSVVERLLGYFHG